MRIYAPCVHSNAKLHTIYSAGFPLSMSHEFVFCMRQYRQKCQCVSISLGQWISKVNVPRNEDDAPGVCIYVCSRTQVFSSSIIVFWTASRMHKLARSQFCYVAWGSFHYFFLAFCTPLEYQ